MKQTVAEKRNIIESYISAYNTFDVEGMCIKTLHSGISRQTR